MAAQIKGKIAQIIGPVIDVVFETTKELPNIYDCLEIKREGYEPLILEVEQKRMRMGMGQFATRALVDGKVVANADMLCAQRPAV